MEKVILCNKKIDQAGSLIYLSSITSNDGGSSKDV